MKKTGIIGIFIIILIICLAVILFYIVDLTMLSENTVGDANTVNNTALNTSSSNTTNDIKNENTVTTDNATNDVFYSKEEMGNAKYSKDQLNNFSIEIKGMTNDISKYINDMSKFETDIKEYMYKNGLVDANVLEVQRSEYQESTKRLGIVFKLNNKAEDKIRVIISENNNIDISDYK